MLIIPMTGKMNWRNPPWITLLLVLLNCSIYFIFQLPEHKKINEYMKFYFTSGLGEIEVGHYLKDTNESPKGGKIPPAVMVKTYKKMMSDKDFMAKLENDEIISMDSPDHARWKGLRVVFLKMKSEVFPFTERYGYKPATGNLQTAFTYMFLHGGVIHLLGNMIFLWLVGCSLELGVGRPAFLFIYLSTGILAALFFGMIYRQSTMPLVGASGAIAGIIGAYTVLFGLRKVKIFLTLGFYFNYTKVSAIFLLPVWIGNELFQLKWGGGSNVAYVAHIAGLVCGAGMALGQLKLLGGIRTDFSEDGRVEKVTSLVEQALQRLAVLDLEAARSLVHEALALEPENRAALTCLFNIEKLDPGGERFLSAAERLLLSFYWDPGNHDALHGYYNEYIKAANPAGFSPDLCAKLSQAFSDRGFLKDSRTLIALLHSKDPQSPTLPATLLKLSRAYLRSGMKEEGRKGLKLLCQKYPDTPESHLAMGLLNQATSRSP